MLRNSQHCKTTGLTVSLGHGLLSLGQEIAAPLMRMGKVQDDRLKAAYAWKAGRLIHENFSKDNPLEHNSGFSLNLSLGTNKSYSRTESVTKEYAGSTISAGEKASITATEHGLTIQGSTVEGKDVALAAKQNIELLAGENSNQRVGGVIASALNVEHFNHLPHEFQESFVDEVTNAPNNEAKLKVIEKYYALSQTFQEAEPEKAEDMEEAFMDILETITKYDGCGIKFQVDREQGLHQNLAAANAFLQLNHYAQYLPAVFSNIVVGTAAAITAPVSVVSGVLKYGPATYEICTDIIREDDNALFIDTEKHVGIRITSIGAKMFHVPKYIIIPVASGVKVYINAKYKNDSKGDQP